MYFGVTLTFIFDLTSYWRKEITKRHLCFAFLFSVGFGTLMEIIQCFLPWRAGSIYDFIANTLGVILAIIIIIATRYYRHE